MIKREELLLYAITDGSENLPQKVELAIKGGATIVQIREKRLTHSQYVAKVKQLVPVCHKYGVKLIVNDNYQVALEGGADGVHLGQSDGDICGVRHICGENFVIGATAKTISQALSACEEGAEYLGVGAGFPSDTKIDAIRITGEDFRKIAEKSTVPCVAIGGINLQNINLLRDFGASGIAVVSAIFASNDIENAAKTLKVKVKDIIN